MDMVFIGMVVVLFIAIINAVMIIVLRKKNGTREDASNRDEAEKELPKIVFPKREKSAVKKPESESASGGGIPEDELIAVISAAIAAYSADGGGNLIVRKIKRISGGDTPWQAAAREEWINSRKF